MTAKGNRLQNPMLTEKFISPLFFLLFLLTGLLMYDDYGLSWDAEYCRERGDLNYHYIHHFFSSSSETPSKTEFMQEWEAYPYHDHGVFFDLLAYSLEKLTGVETGRNAYLLRHLLIFLFFFSGSIFFYFILRKRMNWKYALAGVFFLILSPRIFAHAFFNPKDIVFMSAVTASIYTAMRFMQKSSPKNIILFALAGAIAIDIRITGLFIPIIVLVLFVMFALTDRKGLTTVSLKVLAYILLLSGFIILFWPYLWNKPLASFADSISSLSAYAWDDNILYMGKWISATDVPWHYIPVWVGISTPILYLLLFGSGLAAIIKGFDPHLKKWDTRFDLLITGFLFVPLLAVILLQSTLYDGWRQLYFIYPAFLIIAMCGLKYLFSWRISGGGRINKFFSIALLGILILHAVFMVRQMIRLHPFQHLYFNLLAGENPETKYDLDYWGLSYRATYEKLLEEVKADSIFFVPANNAGFINLNILQEEQKQKLIPLSWDSARYFVTNYRWVDRQKVSDKEYPYKNEVFSINKNGMKISGVYILREKAKIPGKKEYSESQEQ